MEKVILWEKEIRSSLVAVSEEQLDEFLDLLSYIQSNHIDYLICEEALEDEGLWEWLGAKNQTSLNDIKRELMRYIQKARSVDDEEYGRNLDKVGKGGRIKAFVLLFEGKRVYDIATMAQYYKALRSYLAMEKKDTFCKDLPECFPNICFSEGIETTVNTLNKKFEELRGEITEHLTQIDAYQGKFLEMSEEHKSNREIAEAFTAHTGIACSPQGGRKGVQALKESCFNAVTGQMETITCELHTKFETYNIDREKQDRIYFFPGKRGIREGKVIVKYIGDHL